MHLRNLAALALAVTLSSPAFAHGHKDGYPGNRPGGRDMRPDWKGDRYDDSAYDNVRRGPQFGHMREQWLMDCRSRVAGRSGIGSFVGAPIDEPIGASGPGDACETALDNYYASIPPGYDYAGYGPGTIMVPVVIPGKPCVEHVTTEYVRPARRFIPRPAPRLDKRIRIIPDKRIPMK